MADRSGNGLRLLNGEEEAGRIECEIGGRLEYCDTWSLLWVCIGCVGFAEGKAALVDFG